MKISEEQIKVYEGKILKVILENGNTLRGRFIEPVIKDGSTSVVIQSNTYTFQIDQEDIKDIEVIVENYW